MDNFDGYIADIYREMEAELIGSMKRNLGLHEAEEALTGLKYPQWQAMKLKELRRFQRENERIMGKKLSGLPDEVSRHMIDELNQGSKHELKRYRKALKKGYKSAVVMKDSFFHVNDRKVQGLINALNNDLASANSAVLRMMNDQYRQTIFKAGMFVSNGVYTEEQAVKKAVEEFEKKGLNCIEYKDGRRVNIADYASMAVRTANQRAYMVGEGEFRKSIGETLVIISRHSTSCDLCKPFEGKVLIDDVYSGGTQEDGDYMLLSQAMEQGLYHPRCRHGLGTYYPELEDINGYETEDNRLNDYSGNVDNSGENGILKETKRKPETKSKSTADKSPSKDTQKAKTGSDLFSDKTKEKLYRDERILAGNRYETAIVYDADGNVVFKKKGTADEVKFTAEERKKMKGCVVTHNHPNGGGFSGADIYFAKKYKITEMRACEGRGAFVIKTPKKWPAEFTSADAVDKAINSIYANVGSKYRDIAAQNGISPIAYLNDIEIETFEEFSKKYGFEFRWEKK